MKNRCYADITHKNLILFMFPFLYWSQAIYCVVGTNEIQLETSLKRSEEEKLTKKKLKLLPLLWSLGGTCGLSSQLSLQKRILVELF